MFAFQFVLMPLGKIWIHLSSTARYGYIGRTGFFNLGKAISLREGKVWIQILPELEGLAKYIIFF